MKDKIKTQDDIPASALYSPEDSATMKGVMLTVMAEGFVPRAALYTKFGDEPATKAIAILHKAYRVLVECDEKWEGSTVKGFKLANKGLAVAEIKKLPAELAFLPELMKTQKKVYGEYRRVSLKCRFLVDVLGALPTKSEKGESVLAFKRDWTKKDIIIQRFGPRAMLRRGLRFTNRSEYSADYFGFENIVIRDPKMCEDEIRGGQNEKGESIGLTRSECLSAGTEFIITAMVPMTFINATEYVDLIRICGQVVGLSPGRSAGYGNFEVLSVEPS